MARTMRNSSTLYSSKESHKKRAQKMTNALLDATVFAPFTILKAASKGKRRRKR